jgi:hypothetical protein
LDIFQMIVKNNEPTKELVKRELLIFWSFQGDVKEIKCPLWWWEKHEPMFLIVGFLVC